MAESPNEDRPAPMICFCRTVRADAIQRALDEGARTVEELIERTNAGTGCGTCRFDLERLVREHQEDGESGQASRAGLSTALALLGLLLVVSGLYTGCGDPDHGSDLPPEEARSGAPETGPRPVVRERETARVPEATTTGRLIDTLGNPIAGARILRLGPDTAPRVTRSDEFGRFRVGGTESEDLVLLLADQFEPRLVPTAEPDLGLIELRSGRPLQVEVRGERDRRRVPGARLSFRPAVLDPVLGEVATKALERSAETDQNGLGVLRGLFPMTGILRVEAEGYGVVERVLGREDRAERLDLLLPPGRTLRGQLLDASGQAVGEVLVEVSPRAGGPSVLAETRTDGSFVCEGVPIGPVELAAIVEGTTIPLGTADPSADRAYRLPPLQRIQGRVVDSGGLPVAAATVTRLSNAGDRTRRVGTFGRFEFQGWTAGIAAFRGSSKGFVPALHLLRDPTDGPIELRLDRSRTVTGRIVDATGRPVGDALVRVVDASAPPRIPARSTDGSRRPEATSSAIEGRVARDGSFALSADLSATEVRVLVEAPGSAPTFGPRLVLAPADTGEPLPQDVDLDCGTIRLPAPGHLEIEVETNTSAGTRFHVVGLPGDLEVPGPSVQLAHRRRREWNSGPLGPGSYLLIRTPGPFAEAESLLRLPLEIRTGVRTIVRLDREGASEITERPVDQSPKNGDDR